MKKENEIGDNRMKTTNSFHTSNKDDMEHPRIEQAREEPTTPPISPFASTQEEGSSSERVPRFRSLQELYEVTENQENLTLFCLFANFEHMNF